MSENKRIKWYYRGVQISKSEDQWYLDHDFSSPYLQTLFTAEELADSPFIIEKLEPEEPLDFQIKADDFARNHAHN